MDIPAALLSAVREGRVALFLGAGASAGAKDSQGRGAPLGDDLRNLLSDEFLGGQYKRDSLGFVADLAVSEADLYLVQDYVADRLRELQPPEYLRLLPTFRWRGIASTNYDLLVENVYRTVAGAVQGVVPFLSNDDRVEDRVRSAEQVPLLKLHGCITRTHDDRLPLILTLDQYAEPRTNRHLVYNLFEGWAYDGPVVFVGYGLQDPDIRAITHELSKLGARRPHYYMVRPSVRAEEVRFWASQRITVLDGTFEDFLNELDRLIPSALRPLLQKVDNEHPIRARFVVNEPVSAELREFLSNDVDYVYPGIAIKTGTPQAFYKGFDQGWYPIEQELDVRRSALTEQLLTEVIIRIEEDRPTNAELYVVKAEAGAGKSVFLRRLAWEASRDAGVLTLYTREYGSSHYEGLREIHRVTGQRIFLFADNAADRVAELSRIVADARKDSLPLTVITAERTNAWNMYCERLNEWVNGDFKLRYLSHAEIGVLVRLLEDHGSLGPHLGPLTVDERIREFAERAGRQLLVALHEATMGAPFEEILFDEYNEIEPRSARELYLTVCVLNRLVERHGDHARFG